MTALNCESCDGVGVPADLFATGMTMSAPSGTITFATPTGQAGNWFFCADDPQYTANVQMTFTTVADTVIIGARFFIKSLANIGVNVVKLIELRGDTGATLHGYLRVLSDGTVRYFRGDGTQLGPDSAAGVVMSNTSVYVAVFVTLSNSDGKVKVEVNGEQVITADTLDTRNGGTNAFFDAVRFYLPHETAQTVEVSCRDIVVCDNLRVDGAGPHNFFGDVAVTAFVPVGVGELNAWTPSAGFNWENLDELTSDGNTTINSTQTPAAKDFFTFNDLPDSVGDIHFIKSEIWAKEEVAGTREGRIAQRSADAFEAYSPTKAFDTTWTVYPVIFGTTANGLNWNKDRWNDSQHGYILDQ